MPRKRKQERKCLAPWCGQVIPIPQVFCMRHLSKLPQQLRDALQSALLAGKRAESVKLVHHALDWLADQLAGQARQPGEKACRGED
jgi:hypothetical protein